MRQTLRSIVVATRGRYARSASDYRGIVSGPLDFAAGDGLRRFRCGATPTAKSHTLRQCLAYSSAPGDADTDSFSPSYCVPYADNYSDAAPYAHAGPRLVTNAVLGVDFDTDAASP